MKNLSLRLFLAAWLTCLLIQIGHFEQDTRLRWTFAHSLVHDDDIRLPYSLEWCLTTTHGRNDVIQHHFGMGQGLVMLPADIVGTRLLGPSPDFRLQTFVAMATFPALDALAVVLAFSLLQALGFRRSHALLGAMAFFFGTSFFHYSQDHQEVNLLVLVVLLWFWGVFRSRDTGDRWPLWIASFALGFSLLVRLPMLLNLPPLLYFGARIWRGNPAAERRRYWIAALSCLFAFAVTERLLHWWRFGEWTSHYIGYFAARCAGAAEFFVAPSRWPGLIGPLFSPRKSIFLFDPLLLPALVVYFRTRKELSSGLRDFFHCALVMLSINWFFYSSVPWWAGDISWGSRYLCFPVQLLSLLAIPLLLRLRPALPRYALPLLMTIAVAVQLSSVLLYAIFEYQTVAGVVENWFLASHGIGRRIMALVQSVFTGPDVLLGQVAPLLLRPERWPFAGYGMLGFLVFVLSLALWYELFVEARREKSPK